MDGYFLPSEIARLILGYLKDNGLQKTFTTFLQECPGLVEYRQVLRTGRVPPTTVSGQNLTDILNEFADLKLKALRSGQAVVRQFVETPRCVRTVTSAEVNNVSEQAESSTHRQRRATKVQRSQRHARPQRAREKVTQKNGDQVDVTPASRLASSSESTSVVPILDTSAAAVADAEEIPSVQAEANQATIGCITSNETKAEMVQEVKVKQSVTEETAHTRVNSDENVDFLGWLLEETHFHEKLAENINKVLCEGGTVAVRADTSGAAGTDEQAGSPLGNNKMKKCGASVNKDQINRGVNISQIIEMTESDPAFQNFLQLFQQGTAIPVSHFDVPVVNLSIEPTGQPISEASGKECTSYCDSDSHKSLQDEPKCQNSVPSESSSCNPMPQTTSIVDPNQTSVSHFISDHIPDKTSFNCGFSEMLKASPTDQSSTSGQHQHSNSQAHNGDGSVCPSRSRSSETESHTQIVNGVAVSSSECVKALVCSEKSSHISNVKNCEGKREEMENVVDGRVADVELGSNCLQFKNSPITSNQNKISITPDENSLTAFSLIEKSVAEMRGEPFVHRSMRNTALFQTADFMSDCGRSNSSVNGEKVSNSADSVAHKVRHGSKNYSSQSQVDQYKFLGKSEFLTGVNMKDNSVNISKQIICPSTSIENMGTTKLSCPAPVPSNFSEIGNAENVITGTSDVFDTNITEHDPHAVTSDEVPCQNGVDVKSVYTTEADDASRVENVSIHKTDCLPALSIQDKALLDNKQHGDRPVNIRSKKGRQNNVYLSNSESVSAHAVICEEKHGTLSQRKVSLSHEEDEQILVETPVIVGKHMVLHKETIVACPDDSFICVDDSLSDVKETESQRQQESSRACTQNGREQGQFLTEAVCTQAAPVLQSVGGNCTVDSSERKTGFPLEHAEVTSEQTNHGARNSDVADIETCNDNVSSHKDRFQSGLSSSKKSRWSRSMSSLSAHRKPYKRNSTIEHFHQHSIIGSPPYSETHLIGNSPPQHSHSKQPHVTSCSLPATFRDTSPSFSESPNKIRLSPVRQKNGCVNRSQLRLSSTDENHPQGGVVRRKVIAVHSQHAPFIPEHCRRNPSRRIVPKEVDFTTPSPLQEFPSSPVSYVVDLPSSQLNSPFSPKEHISRQHSVGSILTSPDERVQVNFHRSQKVTSVDEADCVSRSQPHQYIVQQKHRGAQANTSQLENHGIKLPPSPSDRKPRRVVPIMLSSAVNKDRSNLCGSSASGSRNSPIIDDAKIVSSTTDSSSLETEAFRMLKSFLASSYSKPQPRQEITSTNQKASVSMCGCLTRSSCKHQKGRGKKYLLESEISSVDKDHHDNAVEKNNASMGTHPEPVEMGQDACPAEPGVSSEPSAKRQLSADVFILCENRSVGELAVGLNPPDQTATEKSSDLDHSSVSLNSFDNKSFAVVGVMEHCLKADNVAVERIQGHGTSNQATCSLSAGREIVSLTNGAKDGTDGAKRDNLCSAENLCNHVDNEILNKTFAKTAAGEDSKIGNSDKVEGIDNSKSLHTSAVELANFVTDVNTFDKDDISEIQSVMALPSLPHVAHKADSLWNASTPFGCSMNSQFSSSSRESLHVQVLPQKKTSSSVPKQNNLTLLDLKPCQERGKQNQADYQSHRNSALTDAVSLDYQSHRNSALTDAVSLVSDASGRKTESLVASQASVRSGRCRNMCTEYFTPNGVYIPDRSSASNTNNTLQTTTVEELTIADNKNPHYLAVNNNGTTSISFSEDETARLNSSVLSPERLSGFLSNVHILPSSMEQPCVQSISSGGSQVKPSSSSSPRQGAKDLGEGHDRLAPGSLCGSSLLSRTMAECGIPFEGSNLTTPHAFSDQNPNPGQVLLNPQIHLVVTSASDKTAIKNVKRGRKPRSKAQKPNHKNVANILPAIGFHEWDMAEENNAQPPNRHDNYAKISQKLTNMPAAASDLKVRGPVKDETTLLCDIQVIPSANGPVIIIPPGHEGVLQKLLSNCAGAVPQINSSEFPKQPLPSVGGGHMTASHGCSLKSSFPATDSTDLPGISKNLPAESEIEKSKCLAHIVPAESKPNQDSSYSVGKLMPNQSFQSTCSAKMITAGLEVPKGTGQRSTVSHLDSSTPQDGKQFTQDFQTKSLRNMERKIEFTHLKTVSEENNKTDKWRILKRDVRGQYVTPAKHECFTKVITNDETDSSSEFLHTSDVRKNLEVVVSNSNRNNVVQHKKIDEKKTGKQDKHISLDSGKKRAKQKDDAFILTKESTERPSNKNKVDRGNKDVSIISGTNRDTSKLKKEILSKRKGEYNVSSQKSKQSASDQQDYAEKASEQSTIASASLLNENIVLKYQTKSSANERAVTRKQKNPPIAAHGTETVSEVDTCQSPVKNKYENSKSHERSARENSNNPIDDNSSDEAFPTKRRRLSHVSGRNQSEMQHFTGRKNVQVLVDFGSGEVIRSGLAQNINADKLVVERGKETEVMHTSAARIPKQKSKNKLTLQSKKSSRTRKCVTESEKLQSVNNKSKNITPIPHVTRNVFQYVKSLSLNTLQGLCESMSSQGNEQSKQASCVVKREIIFQNRASVNPQHENNMMAPSWNHCTEGRRQNSPALFLNEVQNEEKVVSNQYNSNANNADSCSVANSDSMKHYYNETENAVASLELCMKEQNAGYQESDYLCSSKETCGKFMKESSIIEVDGPTINSFQNSLQADTVPVALSPYKQSQSYSFGDISPMKLHLPPKKRLSSDFIISSKASSLNDTASLITESVFTLDETNLPCSSHIPVLQHLSTSAETVKSCSQVGTALHKSLTPEHASSSNGHISEHCTLQTGHCADETVLDLSKFTVQTKHLSSEKSNPEPLSCIIKQTTSALAVNGHSAPDLHSIAQNEVTLNNMSVPVSCTTTNVKNTSAVNSISSAPFSEERTAAAEVQSVPVPLMNSLISVSEHNQSLQGNAFENPDPPAHSASPQTHQYEQELPFSKKTSAVVLEPDSCSTGNRSLTSGQLTFDVQTADVQHTSSACTIQTSVSSLAGSSDEASRPSHPSVERLLRKLYKKKKAL